MWNMGTRSTSLVIPATLTSHSREGGDLYLSDALVPMVSMGMHTSVAVYAKGLIITDGH